MPRRLPTPVQYAASSLCHPLERPSIYPRPVMHSCTLFILLSVCLRPVKSVMLPANFSCFFGNKKPYALIALFRSWCRSHSSFPACALSTIGCMEPWWALIIVLDASPICHRQNLLLAAMFANDHAACLFVGQRAYACPQCSAPCSQPTNDTCLSPVSRR